MLVATGVEQIGVSGGLEEVGEEEVEPLGVGELDRTVMVMSVVLRTAVIRFLISFIFSSFFVMQGVYFS